MLENISDGFFAVDTKWHLTYVNKQMEALLKIDRRRVLGQNVWENFPTLIGTECDTYFHEALQSGQPIHFESFLSHFEAWYQVHIYPSREGLLVHYQNTTRQKFEKLVDKDTNHYFQAAFQAATDAMALSTPDGIVFAANPAYFHLYGYSARDILGKPFTVVYPNEQRDWAERIYQYMFSSPVAGQSYETEARRADGERVIIETHYNFITQQGIRTAMLSVMRDITERKKAEELFKDKELKLQMALNTARLSTWDWDITRDIIHCSSDARFDQQVQPLIEECSFEEFLQLIHPEDRARFKYAIDQALVEGEEYTITFRFLLPDGSIIKKIHHGQVVFSDEGHPLHMLGISMDEC